MLIVDLLTPNNSAIAFCDSQTDSSLTIDSIDRDILIRRTINKKRKIAYKPSRESADFTRND